MITRRRRCFLGARRSRSDLPALVIGARQKLAALAWADVSVNQRGRERIKAVGDEALIDVDDYTMMLAAKRK